MSICTSNRVRVAKGSISLEVAALVKGKVCWFVGGGGGGCIAQSIALHPVAPGSSLGVPEESFLAETYSLDVAEINQQQHCLVLGGQCRSFITLIGPI